MPTFGLRPNNLHGVVALGAVTIVFVATYSSGARRLLSGRVFSWLGRVSFSVYLIHEPIILALRYHFSTAQPAVLAFVGVSSSFVVAELFYRLIEGPSHRLARRVNRWLTIGDQRTRHAVEVTPPRPLTRQFRGNQGRRRPHLLSIWRRETPHPIEVVYPVVSIQQDRPHVRTHALRQAPSGR